MSIILEEKISLKYRASKQLEAKSQPFIKWAGGKQSLTSQLIPQFPRVFGRYFEPFIGGGGVFFELNPNSSVIADLNYWLIDTYEAIRMDWSRVATVLDGLQNSKDDFLRIRKVCPKTLDVYSKAAYFIYLNKTCFRGLFRVNKSGQFNVPYGAYDRRYYDPDNLNAVSKTLQSTEIRKGDFEAAVVGVKPGDFVYFDPPYYKLGGYSDFNRYTSGQFGISDHLRLASLCNELTSMDAKWAVSNSDTPFIRSIYRQYKMIEISARREINLNSKNRNISELLILNF